MRMYCYMCKEEIPYHKHIKCCNRCGHLLMLKKAKLECQV